MDYHVYILKSKLNGKYYIGQTQNIDKRLVKHNKGEVRSTSKNTPWELIWSEKHETRSSAFKREKQIKSWKSRRKVEDLIRNSGGPEK